MVKGVRTPPEIRRQTSEVLHRIERTINHLTPLGDELLNARRASRDDTTTQELTQQYQELQEKLHTMHSEAATYKAMLEQHIEEPITDSQHTPKQPSLTARDEAPKDAPPPDDVGDTSPRETFAHLPPATGVHEATAFMSAVGSSSTVPPESSYTNRSLPRSPSLPVGAPPLALRNAKVVGRVRQLSELLAETQRTCQRRETELASKDADLQEARADQKIAEAYASSMTAQAKIAATARKEAEDAREELEHALDEMKAMRDDARQRAQQAETNQQESCVAARFEAEIRSEIRS